MLSGEATLAGTEYGPEAEPDHTLRPDATLTRLHDPNFASADAALATAVSGPAPSRTASRLTARLAAITRITIVKGIQRQYQLAGHKVTVAADWDLGDDHLTLDQITSTYELRRYVASSVAVLGDPERGEQLLGDAVYFLLRSKSFPTGGTTTDPSGCPMPGAPSGRGTRQPSPASDVTGTRLFVTTDELVAKPHLRD